MPARLCTEGDEVTFSVYLDGGWGPREAPHPCQGMTASWWRSVAYVSASLRETPRDGCFSAIFFTAA